MSVPPPPPPPPLPSSPGVIENGRFEDNVKAPPHGFIVFINITNTVTHLCLGAVAFAAIFFANNFIVVNNSLTNHIYLCVTGYIILMSQAVLSLNTHTGWAHSVKNQTKRKVHWFMQIIGSILAISGSIIRITDIEQSFQSTHGILGIVAMIFTVISLIGGVVNLFSSNMKINPKIIKVVHSCFGSLTLIVAFLSLIFAFNFNFYRFYGGNTNANFCIGFSVVALAGTLLSPWITVFNRIFN